MEEGIEKILSLYENSGYPFGQVLVENLDLVDSRQVHVALRIMEGPLVKVSQIEFKGASASTTRALLKEMGFQPGENFSQEEWEERLQRLRNLPYVREVGNLELNPGSNYNEAVVSIPLEEKKNNSFSGLLGYAPGSASGKGYLTGSLAVGLSNFLGGIREFDIRWSKKDQKSYDLRFTFAEYWLWDTPLSAKLGFQQSQTDSSYSGVQIEEETSCKIKNHISVSSILGWGRTYQKGYLKKSFASSRRLWLGLGARWNNLDYNLNPRRGLDLEAQTRIVNWAKTDTGSVSPSPHKDRQIRTEVSLWNFMPLGEKQTLGLRLAHWQVSSSRGALSPAELYKLGGINTLRGYLSEQFWANKAFLTTLEYRFLLSPEARFYLFTDLASFKRNYLEQNILVNKQSFKLGYGLGLWLSSKLGLLNLDLGLGQSDDLENLKVHVGLKNRF